MKSGPHSLSPAEQRDLDGIGGRLARFRRLRHLTQTELAVQLKTSQSRVAKMEQGDPTVSLDLLIQSLYRVGMNRRSVAAAM